MVVRKKEYCTYVPRSAPCCHAYPCWSKHACIWRKQATGSAGACAVHDLKTNSNEPVATYAWCVYTQKGAPVEKPAAVAILLTEKKVGRP